MSTRHTPGPWSWGDDYQGLYGSGENNEVLTYAWYENMWLSYGGSREANARLIASAPDLLEALQNIVSDHEFCGDNYGERRNAWIETARAAIAKATGEQP